VRRQVKIDADGVQLTVTIEGDAPIELVRKLASEVVRVGFSIKSDFINVTETIDAETVVS
jgi:thiamine monophosphate synthase